jgi:hypothetical protein
MISKSGIRRCAAGALALGLLGSAATAAAQQNVVVAEEEGGGYEGPNAYLFSSGLITTGLSYTPALIVAINSDAEEDDYLYAPFIGPWLDLAARDGGSKTATTLLVVDGVFQTIGALQIIGSFIFTGGDASAARSSSTAVATETVVAPSRLPGDGYGLVAVGRF